MFDDIGFIGTFFTLVSVGVILLSLTGKTLGIRLICAKILMSIFEWASEVQVEEEQDLYTDLNEELPPDEPKTPASLPDLSGEQKVRRRNRKSSHDDSRPLITRQWSSTIDRKLHASDVDTDTECESNAGDFVVPSKSHTVDVIVNDMLEFVSAGIESIIEDDVTSRFKAAQLPSWNLLWKLNSVWILGVIYRYSLLLPIRFFVFLIGLGVLFTSSLFIGFVPNERLRTILNHYAMLTFFRVMSRAAASIIRFHNKHNRPTSGIVVANHTSPIDVMVLSCDNVYAMIGQKHGGVLGLIQQAASRCSHHIWFERNQSKDRNIVRQTLKDHVSDPKKLPILIFPEGTCINNTSVMQFKKGSFEVSDVVHPIAMRYDNRLGDAFWNSSEYGYFAYLIGIMTSWALMCDVWYLPPVRREPDEDPIDFARRVKRMIAQQGGLVDLEWDGNLKRAQVPEKLKDAQKDLFFQYLARTTTICEYTDDEVEKIRRLSATKLEELPEPFDEDDIEPDETVELAFVRRVVQPKIGKMDGKSLFWVLKFSLAVLTLIIFLSVTGKSTGVREFCAQLLLKIFEWASRIRAENEKELYGDVDDEISQVGSGGAEFQENKDQKARRRNKKAIRVNDNRPLIDRHWSSTIDTKLHDSNFNVNVDTNKLLESDSKNPEVEDATPTRLIVREMLNESLEFVCAGVEAIVQDEVTGCFKAAQLSSWNLLTRNHQTVRFNWKLQLLWYLGLNFRYLILLPMRFALFIIGVLLLCTSSFIISSVPSEEWRTKLNRYSMLCFCRISSRAFSSIIKFHNKHNRPTSGIVVANHTSPIDVMILSCDNVYAMIGQRQGGVLGFIQKTVSRCAHHIWFERTQAKDRNLVRQALKEHVEDPKKSPILIFPEGTCINNTSVMLFKKGSFEVSDVVHPIAMRYDNRLGDAFWNSSKQGYFAYLVGMMTSWALMCDVWYLPPVHREPDEDSIDFARRVKRMIAQQGGLVDLEWDGNLKRSLVPEKLKAHRKDLFFQYLTRTTPIRHYTPSTSKNN
ncbi:Acyltransferase [Aphelenchoides bicaudatus]|nr:Acyltransferase [Aphelenchoides bicaudatus]